MKKLIYLLSTIMLVIMFPIMKEEAPKQSLSISGNWDSYKTRITEGSGTSDDPYLISSAQELAYLNDFLKEGNNRSASYKLTNNIDLTDHYFTTIQETFMGTLDGNQHAIIGLTTNENIGAGLFVTGQDCLVKSLVFENISIKSNGKGYSGTLFANINRSEINNVCVMNGNINVLADCAWAAVGGIIGWAQDSIVSYCYNAARITCDSNDVKGYYVGGIIGCQVSSGTYDNLVFYGAINVYGLAKDVNIGGIIGASTEANLTNCWSDSLQETNLSIYTNGAIIGYNSKKIINSYYNSNVPADGNGGTRQDVYTGLYELPSSWDKEYWAVDPNINIGRPYLKWLYWQNYVI